MLPGQTIIGDDIAYLRKKQGRVHAVNVEKGVFGIIRDVNPKDDPIIYQALTSPIEVIFSNVLIDDCNRPCWQDEKGNDITASHRNARYCLSIPDLANCDSMLDNPNGVPVGAIVYGGRDSDTWVPVEQAHNWTEGIILKGASLESETTAATLGKEGVRTFNLMSNLDFLSIPLGQYIQNNLDFANGLDKPPFIFSVNYFLRGKDHKYLNGIADKLVWILWAELRANGDVDAIETPTGLIPRYQDLAELFKDKLGELFAEDDYVRQFTIRVPENLAKLDRIERFYRTKVPDCPKILYDTYNDLRKRLRAAAGKHGDYISPLALA